MTDLLKWLRGIINDLLKWLRGLRYRARTDRDLTAVESKERPANTTELRPPLVVAPNYDGLTERLSAWARQLALEFGADFLGGEDCTPEVLHRTLREGSYPFVVFAGHGDTRRWLTNWTLSSQVYFDAQGRPHGVLASERVFGAEFDSSIFAVACSTSKSLGVHVRGLRRRPAYLGYSDRLAIMFNPVVRDLFLGPHSSGARAAYLSSSISSLAGTELKTQLENEYLRASAPFGDADDPEMRQEARMYLLANARAVDERVRNNL